MESHFSVEDIRESIHDIAYHTMTLKLICEEGTKVRTGDLFRFYPSLVSWSSETNFHQIIQCFDDLIPAPSGGSVQTYEDNEDARHPYPPMISHTRSIIVRHQGSA